MVAPVRLHFNDCRRDLSVANSAPQRHRVHSGLRALCSTISESRHFLKRSFHAASAVTFNDDKTTTAITTENTENGYATAESNRIRGGRECDSGLSSVNSVSLWLNCRSLCPPCPEFTLSLSKGGEICGHFWLRLRRAVSAPAPIPRSGWLTCDASDDFRALNRQTESSPRPRNRSDCASALSRAALARSEEISTSDRKRPDAPGRKPRPAAPGRRSGIRARIDCRPVPWI